MALRNRVQKIDGSKTLRTFDRYYKGFKLEDVVYRPNALTVLNAPSRYGNTLTYPYNYHQK